MSRRARQSTASVAPSPSQRPGNTQTQSGYEAPQFTLNPEAQRAIASLTREHKLQALDKQFTEVQNCITNSAAEVNERLQDKIQATRKAKAKQQATQNGEGDDVIDAIEADLEQMKAKVESMTKRMEEGMRKAIDGQHAVEAMKNTTASAAETARADASTQATTLNARSQPRRRRGRGAEDDEDAEEEEEYQDFTPTDPDGGTQAVASVSEAWMRKIDDEKMKYQNFSMGQRYAQNNNYKQFKGIVHSARYPDQEVELPHESAWFTEAGAAAQPGVTGESNGEDRDDEIQIQRTKTSTKCPLTLKEFEDPVTSTKCKHTYESSAIMEMITFSDKTVNGQPAGRGRGEKAVQCPVHSCSVMLTKSDLHKDKVIMHQIARLQRAQRLEEEEDDDDADAVRIDSDAPDAEDDDMPVKNEPRGTGRSRSRIPGSTAPMGTEMTGLGLSGRDADGDSAMEQW